MNGTCAHVLEWRCGSSWQRSCGLTCERVNTHYDQDKQRAPYLFIYFIFAISVTMTASHLSASFHHNVFSYSSSLCFRTGRVIRHWESHTQEVCGLQWSPDRQYLASGGNDNKVGQLLKGRGQERDSQGDRAAQSSEWNTIRQETDRPGLVKRRGRQTDRPGLVTGRGRQTGSVYPPGWESVVWLLEFDDSVYVNWTHCFHHFLGPLMATCLLHIFLSFLISWWFGRCRQTSPSSAIRSMLQPSRPSVGRPTR